MRQPSYALVMQMISSRYIGVTLVMLSSICFAFVPNSAKIAMDEGSSLSFLIVSRYAIGVMLLLPVMVWTKAKFFVPAILLLKILMVSALALGLILATYHAVEFLDVGLVLIILYSFPIGVALILHFQRKIKITSKQYFCMLFLIIGLWIMIYDDGLNINFYGLMVSFFGLICFVFFIVFSSDINDVVGSPTLNFYVSFFGLLFLVMLILLGSENAMQFPTSQRGLIAILTNGVFYILSWVLYFEGSRVIGAARSSFLASLEPLFAALLAIILLNQMLSYQEWLGFFIILLSVFIFEKFSEKT